MLSAGVFHKRLNNFIYRRVTEVDSYGGVDFDRTVELRQEVNGELATLTGVEVAYQQNLTFLPGALKGLGVYGNLTYTASNATLTDRSGVGETETITLPGQAPLVGNLSLSYDYKGFNTRISANYADDYILELGDEADEDLFVNNRLQLDWTASYQIGSRFTVFAEFMNLNNAPFETYVGSEETFIQREFYSWWSRAGLKFNL
ncbi:MAG TPA: hypothetical protein DCR93_23400 [Cytophagales bacterium]|nr:hypothetical protein [Cytophagales bacterium]